MISTLVPFLRPTYAPSSDANRLGSPHDVALARRRFFEKRPRNLTFLLQQRYGWMNRYLRPDDRVIELGSGAGLAREFVTAARLVLTDVRKDPWIDLSVDAERLPFANASVDVFIASHLIHHLPRPAAFFDEVARSLKPGGYLLVSDVNLSLHLRLLLWLARHEGWDERSNPFSRTEDSCDRNDPWTGNNTMPNRLFSNRERFEREFPHLKVIEHSYEEVFLPPLAGGVTARIPSIPLPEIVLRAIQRADNTLAGLFPSVLSLGMRIVLQKAPDAV